MVVLLVGLLLLQTPLQAPLAHVCTAAGAPLLSLLFGRDTNIASLVVSQDGSVCKCLTKFTDA